MTKKKGLIFLLIIIAIASFFRLWQLDSIPPGLYPDVAMNGNDALDSLKSGNFKVFYPENNGREGLMMWLIALSFSIFGVSIWSIKIVAAIIGILTILGFYLLIKELFNIQTFQQSNNPTIVALLSSFFLATSFWHTNFSRLGFRAILLPFVLVFSFYFLFRGFRTKKLLDFTLAGIIFGLGFYTYTSFRMAVLLLFFALIFWFFIYKKEGLQKQFIIHTSYFLILVFIVALPIGLYFLENPEYFLSRASGVSIFNQQNPIGATFESLIKHLAMFNFYGDSNWRHNFSGSPMLFWPVGILFLIGFFIIVREIFKKSNYQNLKLLFGFFFPLSAFLIMLLPGVLTYEGIPHAIRVAGVIPSVFIFAGLGGWWIYEKLNRVVKNKKLFTAVCLLFLVAVGYSEFNKYFFEWAKNPNVADAFTKRYADIGNYLNSLPEKIQKYVIINEPGVPVPWPSGFPMPAQTPMFIEKMKYGEIRSVYLLPENLDQIKIPSVIVPMKYDDNLFNELSQKFPQGKIKSENEILIYETR